MLRKKILLSTIVVAIAFFAVAACWLVSDTIDFDKNYFARAGRAFAEEEQENQSAGNTEEEIVPDMEPFPDEDVPQTPEDEKEPNDEQISGGGNSKSENPKIDKPDDKYAGIEDEFEVDIDDDSLWNN